MVLNVALPRSVVVLPVLVTLVVGVGGCMAHHAVPYVEHELHAADVHDGAFVVTGPPPVAPNEVVPQSPGEAYVWVPGYWSWNGSVYVWVPGRYVAARPGVVWVAPRYVYGDGVHLYFHGHWGHHHP